MDSLRATLADQLPALTPSQRRIARHVIHHVNDVLMATQAQRAAQVGTSEARVFRFIHTFGFTKFHAFKDALTKEAFSNFSTTHRLTDFSDKLQGTVLSTILSTDMNNIQEILASLPDERFHQADQAISKAKIIYILGLRSSHALAFYFSFTLRFFFLQCPFAQTRCR
jgi:DNA-binding MurR/RpiR family transcriptional regulator